MSKFERRKVTVTLYPRDLRQELDALFEAAVAAQAAEDSSGPRRQGQKSQAMAKAREYDKLLADNPGEKFDLFEITRGEWRRLVDEHPPRKDEPRDALSHYNTKTFPEALLRASLAESDIDLDDLPPSYYQELENACWKLHNEVDEIPKGFSLVSLIAQAREQKSEAQSDSE